LARRYGLSTCNSGDKMKDLQAFLLFMVSMVRIAQKIEELSKDNHRLFNALKKYSDEAKRNVDTQGKEWFDVCQADALLTELEGKK